MRTNLIFDEYCTESERVVKMILPVNYEDKFAYNIYIEEDFVALKEAIRTLELHTVKYCIISDSNVSSLYQHKVQSVLSELSDKVVNISFTAGEASKNLDTVSTIYKFLIKHKFDRNDILVALGGGVVGDLCGYVAASYLRGLRFIQIPSSLLAQADSSIGGKTGVDFMSYKNIIGAFHMPSLVYSNIDTLKTLSSVEFASGMAEIVKSAIIKDRFFFDLLEYKADKIKAKDSFTCMDMLFRADSIKKAVVEEDPKEKSARALLNFGHTLGHAIEKELNFKLSHGQCVALGSCAAADISMKRYLISSNEKKRIENLFNIFDLDNKLRYNIDIEAVLKATLNDKKMSSGKIKFILINSIGEAFIDDSVSMEEMREGLKSIIYE